MRTKLLSVVLSVGLIAGIGIVSAGSASASQLRTSANSTEVIHYAAASTGALLGSLICGGFCGVVGGGAALVAVQHPRAVIRVGAMGGIYSLLH